MFPTIIAQLGAKAQVDREEAIRLLEIITRETFGYRADAPPEERVTAIEKWNKYYDKMKEDEAAAREKGSVKAE